MTVLGPLLGDTPKTPPPASVEPVKGRSALGSGFRLEGDQVANEDHGRDGADDLLGEQDTLLLAGAVPPPGADAAEAKVPSGVAFLTTNIGDAQDTPPIRGEVGDGPKAAHGGAGPKVPDTSTLRGPDIRLPIESNADFETKEKAQPVIAGASGPAETRHRSDNPKGAVAPATPAFADGRPQGKQDRDLPSPESSQGKEASSDKPNIAAARGPASPNPESRTASLFGTGSSSADVQTKNPQTASDPKQNVSHGGAALAETRAATTVRPASQSSEVANGPRVEPVNPAGGVLQVARTQNAPVGDDGGPTIAVKAEAQDIKAAADGKPAIPNAPEMVAAKQRAIPTNVRELGPTAERAIDRVEGLPQDSNSTPSPTATPAAASPTGAPTPAFATLVPAVLQQQQAEMRQRSAQLGSDMALEVAFTDGQGEAIDGSRATQRGEVQPMFRSPDTARAILTQLADAVRQHAPGKVEVSLHPEELGRLLLVFTEGETGLSVTVSADRAETLDLLRRHSALLEAELRSLGYEDAAFTFADGSGQGQASSDSPDQTADRGDNADPSQGAQQSSPKARAVSEGLDLRL